MHLVARAAARRCTAWPRGPGRPRSVAALAAPRRAWTGEGGGGWVAFAAATAAAGAAAAAAGAAAPASCEGSGPLPASLDGKVALVTGGAGAIGSAIARELAAQGCRIVVLDVDQQRCESFASELPTKSIGISFDITDEAAVQEGYRHIVRQLGPVDVLVNVAGILSNNKLMETSTEEWRKVHAVNYDACFFLAKVCIPHMKKKGWGRVVNISSWAWKSGGLTAGTSYASSKGALVGLTFSLAREFCGDGVTVNAVAPCYVLSPMILNQLSQEKRTELLKVIPVKRFCAPEEVAHAVSFLVSPRAGFITGEVIDMNGGFQMD